VTRRVVQRKEKRGKGKGGKRKEERGKEERAERKRGARTGGRTLSAQCGRADVKVLRSRRQRYPITTSFSFSFLLSPFSFLRSENLRL